jgi:hypothetical protein
VLNRISHIESLAEIAADVFNSIIKCEIPIADHLSSLSRKLGGETGFGLRYNNSFNILDAYIYA